jgi:hypothetical protein
MSVASGASAREAESERQQIEYLKIALSSS